MVSKSHKTFFLYHVGDFVCLLCQEMNDKWLMNDDTYSMPINIQYENHGGIRYKVMSVLIALRFKIIYSQIKIDIVQYFLPPPL